MITIRAKEPSNHLNVRKVDATRWVPTTRSVYLRPQSKNAILPAPLYRRFLFPSKRSGKGGAWQGYVARKYFAADDVEAIFPPPPKGLNPEGQLPVETLAKLFSFALKENETRLKAAEERIRLLEKAARKQRTVRSMTLRC